MSGAGRGAWQTRDAAGGRRGRSLVSALVLVVVLAVVLGGARDASAHDGDIRWRTLVTKHFRVHHPARLARFAKRVAATAEDAYATVSKLFRYRPARRIELTVDDYLDSANGFATSFPYDHVHIRTWPPDPGSDLADNGDWLRGLVFHEVTHIFHLSEASGLSSVINTVLGRTWLPNQFLPRFWVEGLAVYVETRHPGRDGAVKRDTIEGTIAGRAGAAPYLARLRGSLRDGTWPKIAQLTGGVLDWPRARSWYLFGAWMLDYQARRYGHDKLEAFVARYGGRVVPYGIQLLYKQLYGRSASAMWREAKADLARRVAAEQVLRRRGLVPPREMRLLQRVAKAVASLPERGDLPRARRLTRDGEWRGRVRLLPDGRHAVVARAPNNGLARIEQLRLSDGRRTVIHTCEADCDDVVATPDGRWLLFVATRPYQRVYRHREVFAARRLPGGRLGKLRQLGSGMRARDLAVSPDGQWLLWVAHAPDGLTEVRRAPLARLLHEAGSGRYAAGPQILARASGFGDVLGSPTADDAGRVYWTAGTGGQRLIHRGRFDAAGKPKGAVQKLCGGRWLASDVPCTDRGWAADIVWRRVRGAGVISAVRQLGAFRDAASLDLATRRWTTHSWSKTGVTSADLSGAGDVILVEHGGRGFDVRASSSGSVTAAPLPGAVSATSTSAFVAPLKIPPPGEVEAPSPHPGAAYRPQSARLRVEPYRPWTSAWPRAWAPSAELRGTTWDTLVLGLELDGRDALETLAWELSMATDAALVAPSAFGTLTWTRFEPLWTFTGGWLRGSSWVTSGWNAVQVPVDQAVARVGGVWRYPLARGGWRFDWGWRVSRHGLAGDRARWLASVVPEDPFGPTPYRPFEGWTSTANLGVGYDRTERYPNSSVVERRHALQLSAFVDDPLIGSDVERTQLELTGRWTQPLGNHRAFELRARLGYAPTYARWSPPFRLSGLPVGDITTLLTGGPVGDLGVVRGVLDPTVGGQVIAGRAMAWGSAALHLPLPAPGSGLELLPVFLGRMWLSLFADGARIWAGDEQRLRRQPTRGGWAVSGGAELAVALETAYVAQGSLRFGVATAFGDVRSTQWYLRLGP